MDVPGDIWSHIATYLTPDDLGALLTLNRAFLHAALNARYRHVTLRSKSRKELFDFTRLQDSFIVSRARSLFLAPTHLLPDPSDPPPGIATKFIQATMNFLWANDPRVIGFGTPHNVAKKMDHIFVNLKYLDELGLLCRDTWAISPTTRTIVNSAWSRLGTNLHTLMLDMSSLALEQAVLPSLVFPSLKALTLKMHRSSSSTDADALRVVSSTSLPFVTNHRQTLRHFSLVDAGINDFNFSQFLRDLGYFPHLERVDTSVALDSAAPGLWYFLGLHSTRLETLGLSHHQLVEPPSYDGPVLSALKDLSLHLTVYTTTFMTSLLRGSCIKALKLPLISYRHSEVPKILDVFAGHRLRSLLIQIDTLSPGVLDYMSKNLPDLHALSLQIRGYTAPGASQWDPIRAETFFCEVMANKDYSRWQPSVFDLEVCAPESAGCDAVLKKLFPKIRVERISAERWIPDAARGGWAK